MEHLGLGTAAAVDHPVDLLPVLAQHFLDHRGIGAGREAILDGQSAMQAMTHPMQALEFQSTAIAREFGNACCGECIRHRRG